MFTAVHSSDSPVPKLSISERVVERIKPVVKTTTHEQVQVQQVRQPVQIVVEFPVEASG